MSKCFFITATDTDAGKTYFSTILACALTQSNRRVAVFKPISAGCEYNQNGELENDDAIALQHYANCHQSLKQINPIRFVQPIAPHIAAALNNQKISLLELADNYQQVLTNNADVVLCEGAGGWRLPLGNGEFLSDFAKASQLQVILVVNMKLGCLNHALLTYQAIVADGLTCIAWVANCQQPMDYLTENLTTLQQLLPCPLMATLPFNNDRVSAAKLIDLSVLGY